MPLLLALTRIFSYLASAVPLRFLYLFSDLIFLVVYYGWGYRKEVVRENISKAFPAKNIKEINAIIKSFYRHLCDLNIEILKIQGLNETELRRRVRFINPQLIEGYALQNKHLIAVTSHYNNWEWGGLALSREFKMYKILGVYKPLKSQHFDQYFRQLRGKFGMELVPMKSTLRAILKNGKHLTMTTLLSDQTPTLGETEFVTPFMGRTVPVFLGAEKIARLTKYPMIYLAMRRKKRGYYEIEAIPLAEHPEKANPYEITLRHVKILEQEINRQPENWLWSHRRWKHNGKTWPDSVVSG